MARFYPRRFSEPGALRRIRPDRLIRFLEPHRDYLAGRGFHASDGKAAMLDYDALSAILMDPDEHMPQGLVNALYFVHEAATKDTMERLIDDARSMGIHLDLSEESTPADLAVAVWLERPELLERKHAEQRFLRRRNYECFRARAGKRREPDNGSLGALETALGEWFAERRRSRWCRITVHQDGDRSWYLVRHGDPMTREPSIRDGQPEAAYYRPEKFDVVLYDADRGELWINADRKEREVYRHQFAEHLFGDSDHFPPSKRYTLDPLRIDGRSALACADINGLKSVSLYEIRYLWPGEPSETEIRRADDLMAVYERRGRSIPAKAILAGARFRVRFADSKTVRTVEVRPPSTANFTRDDDAPIVEEWLRRRGFVLGSGSQDGTA